MGDTIAAISTAIGEAAISVLRLSGPGALEIAGKVFRGRKDVAQLRARAVHLGAAVDADGAVIDHVLLIIFRGPASYTGEDLVELHCHGGVLVTQKMLGALLHHGARHADAGEFTQRAFLNGKMDLTQAEAVMDLIHAHSTLAMRAAHEQLEGVIGREAEAMREGLIQVLAHIEAYIDFPEEDITPDTGEAMIARIDDLRARAAKLLATSENGRILRSGARTVICGQPNVGKSSLLNLLAGFERAIVSPVAGTTRDTIEEFIQVHGIPLRLVDTAGLRESADAIEQSGIERTSREVERADLILEVVDASVPRDLARRVAIGSESAARRIVVLNKSDLVRDASWDDEKGIAVSCATGAGLDELRAAIRDLVLHGGPLASEHPVAINARHKSCFERVAAQLEAARSALLGHIAPEFVAFELREALEALGEVTGRVDVEQILDVIFSQFCIGK
ncbi:MAG: tRNA uridine-5-carboxymethylaminomethyl(34) synthesis GTPase MnmE [Verrucomicrobiaceae bacterium]|nr:tRNA uridine-5-carboxymethylaminomethyl(34) synthesis GTPase MnmE [Verrucomicrobiaceae bacterium]